MKTTWNALASNPRWRGVVSFIRNWVGAFGGDQGMEADDLDSIVPANLRLPAAVREWYILAANWNQGAMNVWIRPQELISYDGVVWILTDTQGVNHWGVRVAELAMDDPPVVSRESRNENVSSSFSSFVAAMIVNDVLFDYATEAPVELEPDAVHADKMRSVSSCCGDFFADGPLELATIVMFAYGGDGPVYGKARTPAGRALLHDMRRPTA
jgi:hypothetical protein